MKVLGGASGGLLAASVLGLATAALLPVQEPAPREPVNFGREEMNETRH